MKLNITETEVPDHLGGHQGVSHVDVGTLLYLQKEFKIQSMVDIGCGPGEMVKLAKSRNINAHGVDGDTTVNPQIVWDYTKGEYHPGGQLDLAWSVEFLEHVEEQYMSNYMATFQHCKYVFCTAARPGELGHHHVNLQERDYWISKFKDYGFEYMKEQSELIREEKTTMNLDRPERKQFVKKNGMLFKNVGDSI